MNLLTAPFISTTEGKVSLKEILTSDHNYQLQYFFDETQLAMVQLLSSLTTVLLKPSLDELKTYLKNGLTAEQYENALGQVDTKWFEDDSFMQSSFPKGTKPADGPITKLVSGIECGGSPNALGLFSEADEISVVCPDCIHVLNYNLHMNIKGECFGPTGATGIRGGGTISTLISRKTLKETILSNTIAVDYFAGKSSLDTDAETRYMWDLPLTGDVYSAAKIGLERGLFALAYHIHFPLEDKDCVCHVCGQTSNKAATTFQRVKYTGAYGSTKNGRDNGAGWWLHPYTPITIKEDGIYPVCARDQYWQSWQELTSYIIGKETEKSMVQPAYIVQQYRELTTDQKTALLVGGNIADQGSIIGRVYDLYSMPASLVKNSRKLTTVVQAGLDQKEKLSAAFNKLFGIGYDKKFVGGIKEHAMQRFIANAQQIIQKTLLDVDRKEASQLQKDAIAELNKEAKQIFKSVQRKYQHDLPMFKALVKGEGILFRNSEH
jgi:CRISPR system Cascade subunit CasA